MSSAALLPASLAVTLAQTPARRARVLAVGVVGALSVLVSGIYLWALHLAANSGTPVPHASTWAYVVWLAGTVVATLLLWWHQTHPVWVFISVFALHLSGAVLIGDGGLGGVALPLWFSVYALATFARPIIAVTLVSAAWGIATALQLLLAWKNGLTFSISEMALVAVGQGFFFAACFLIGVGMRVERQRTRDAAERALLVEARTRAEISSALSRERNRMARELHDLAAHQIMDVLLTVRAAQLTQPEPVLAEVEQKTAEALKNIRSVVGTLRDDDTQASSNEPEPLADGSARVIARLSQERGLGVSRRIAVGYEPDSAVSATVISVLTEALINAATHAPGAPISVTLEANADLVRLEVTNPVEPNREVNKEVNKKDEHSGFGLIGAGERAHILSGQLQAGIAENGQWTVALTLPATHLEVSQ